METFIEPKKLIENPYYHDQRQKTLNSLTEDIIDAPIIDLIKDINKIPYCFTLQCCFGHFLYNDQQNHHNLVPLPICKTITRVEYRIAYIAFCIENNAMGKNFYQALQVVSDIDPENIQLCSADWFWDRQVNSYVLQVEPERFKDQDIAILGYNEALKIEQIRNELFIQLQELM